MQLFIISEKEAKGQNLIFREQPFGRAHNFNFKVLCLLLSMIRVINLKHSHL